ncbi:hypothetical protein KCTC52924_03866 [Arenibacter antarcticus]|uniref:Septum formation inhibitor Maf n=1 Tax=Arenibacter antarcticus TaxID=2040469 RepID=A0ABW5VED8_9FLAO|nr:septum formation inhibitor Maf [Arenibacter sp. H213]MCM4168301.1 septum formation inhibitor Maf [Arenibacter sp. H213]
MKFKLIPVFFALCFFTAIVSCKKDIKSTESGFVGNSEIIPTKTKTEKTPLSKEFKEYWYSGKAEITSYRLEQARYGEIRDGKAVLIFVTEPFMADKQVKPDQPNSDHISVLKLNSTKKFLTGIYPYSIMNSSFYPVYDNQHAIKLTSSVQEWCGQVFTQLNNRSHFEVNSYSYFESEGDQYQELEKAHLENEIWNKIRINPNNLPTGKIKMVPSLEYLRLAHKELTSYEANVHLGNSGEKSVYTIAYPSLERTLSITFSNSFPFGIESWTESYKSGFGQDAKTLTSTASKIKTLKQAYWQENKNSDVFLRDSLGL